MGARKVCGFMIVAVLLAAVLLAVFGCEPAVPDPVLDPPPIDSAGDVGQYSCIARADGALLIAYRDETNDRLKLARSTDGGLTWSTRFLDWDWQSDVGHHVSIAASGARVAVAYQAAGAADLRCAVSTDSGETWHRHPVDAAGTTGLYTSTAIGRNGTIYIAYAELTSADLKLAWSGDAGATWSYNTIDPSHVSSGQQYVSLAVNDALVSAAYYHATSSHFHVSYAPAPEAAFTPTLIADPDDDGQYCCLRYDAASDAFWLAHLDATQNELRIMRSPGDHITWGPQIRVDGGSSTGRYASLAVSGSSGQNLAIAYYEDWEYRLRVARSTDTGATWTTEVVDEGGVGQWASIVATGADTYAICYYDSLERDLRFAAWDGAAWTLH